RQRQPGRVLAIVTLLTVGRDARRVGRVGPGDEVAAIEVDLGRHHFTGYRVAVCAVGRTDRLEDDDRSMRAVVVGIEDRAPDLEGVASGGRLRAVDLLVPR